MPFDALPSVNETHAFPEADSLGTSLRQARRSVGLSQRGLAEKVGIDISTVQGLERGKGTVMPLLSILDELGHRFLDHDKPDDFGPWIAARRKAAGFSQEALAARIGVSKPTIIQIEHGRGNVRSLLRVFDALVISPTVEPQRAGACVNPAGSAVRYVIYEGDNLDHLKTLTDNSVDSVVTDPPYGLRYMASEWDGSEEDFFSEDNIVDDGKKPKSEL